MMEEEREFTATSFQAFLNENRLMGSRCVETGEIFVPPRPICPRTYSPNMEWVELSGRAQLVAFTSIYIGTSAMVTAGYDRQKPYCTGIIELEEGPRFSALIDGVDAAHPETIRIGQPLQVDFITRVDGVKQLVFKAIPA